MNIHLKASDPDDPRSSSLLSELEGRLGQEKVVNSVDGVRERYEGAMDLATVCLIIQTATPVAALIYDMVKDYIDRREKAEEKAKEQAIPRLKTSWVLPTGTFSAESREEAARIDVEISGIPPYRLGEIEVTIEREYH